MPHINVNVNGITKLLSNLCPSKAAGPDSFQCRLLKNTVKEISLPSLSFLTSLWELVRSPLHAVIRKHSQSLKEGHRSTPANYQPISLTSVTGKLLEHVIQSVVTKHFDKHNILTLAQHGFTKKRSWNPIDPHRWWSHLKSRQQWPDRCDPTGRFIRSLMSAFSWRPNSLASVAPPFYG